MKDKYINPKALDETYRYIGIYFRNISFGDKSKFFLQGTNGIVWQDSSEEAFNKAKKLGRSTNLTNISHEKAHI